VKYSFVTALTTGAIFVAPLSAQSFAGTWNAAMNTPGGAVEFTLQFQQHGDTLTGIVSRSGGDVNLLGTVVRDSLQFSYTITYNDHPLVMTVSARVVGDSLKGNIDFGGQGGDAFWAARSAKKP
jgi:hypothetical protein